MIYRDIQYMYVRVHYIQDSGHTCIHTCRFTPLTPVISPTFAKLRVRVGSGITLSKIAGIACRIGPEQHQKWAGASCSRLRELVGSSCFPATTSVCKRAPPEFPSPDSGWLERSRTLNLESEEHHNLPLDAPPFAIVSTSSN